MIARGVEAIKMYTPPITGELDDNIKEEKDTSITVLDGSNTKQRVTMSSVERYGREWQELLKALDEEPESIRELAFEGHLKTSKFRSIYWSLLLRVLNTDHRTWCLQREQQRFHYDKLQQEFATDPHQIGDNATNKNDDPLSQSSQSVWNQYFNDQELFTIIRLDVVRTFPGVDFFRKPSVQDSMCNILFYYVREHSYIGYRQGMHEILAPVVFVMYGDHQSLLHFKEIAKSATIDETLNNVLNPCHLEADCYSIFCRIMTSIQSYYQVGSNSQNATNKSQRLFLAPDSGHNPNVSSEIEILDQLNLIKDKILAKEDLHLHNYLMKLNIPLHIFGIRWLRLLFGREFALLDLLVLWDAMFADSDRFALPNYIVVAMLIRIRDKLLLSDYTACLTYLMRYPTNVDVSVILRHALHMLIPKKYTRPVNAFVYFTIPQLTTVTDNAMNSKKKTTNDMFNAEEMNAARQTSVNAQTQSLMQKLNATDEALMDSHKKATKNRRLAVKASKDNNAELIRLELKNAQTVITEAHSKLQSYLHTIQHYIPKQSPPEVLHALHGIAELCQYLDVKFMHPSHSYSGPIEKALEANERQSRNQKQKTEAPKTNSKIFVNPLFKNEKPCNSNKLPQADFYTEYACNYEKPDIDFMLQCTRLLGNCKEIELRTIVSKDQNLDHQMTNRNLDLPVADPTSFHLKL